LYDKACAKLVNDEFDCAEDQLLDFMTALKQRADEFGWSKRIMMIPKDPQDPTSTKLSLLEEHGNIPMEAITKWEKGYVDQQTRQRQDMQCLYKALMATLSRVGRTKVSTEKEKYILKDANGADAYSGNLLLKVILTKSTVDNRSGAFSIRMELADLPNLIEKVGFDITKFNERVKGLTEDLSRRGEKSADLPFNLFQAYKMVPVPPFQTFIDRLKDEADERKDGKEITEIVIMDRCENKFKNLQKEGIWKVSAKDEDKILALEAKIKKLEKRGRGKTGSGRTGRDPAKKRSQTGDDTKRSTKRKIDVDKKPKDVKKPVKIDGKTWWWCSDETGGMCTGKLRRHKPQDCKGAAYLMHKNAQKKLEEDPEYKLKLKAKEHAFRTESDSDE
jgi:hypothetical protein